MKLGDNNIVDSESQQDLNSDILAKFNAITANVTKNIESYKFGEAAHAIYDFIWHDLADKYIEETKDKEDHETKNTLAYLLINCLKLLHPFMPFITEEIYSKLPIDPPTGGQKLLLVEEWPLTK